ncbi:hypothetical protein JCGZ_17462 [Jatropha curcas]|uniref:Uncharacterized protein n=1 Tax=Jatropha curcas TaxID=180498 RepID=A0A067LK95_JATCU|nr:hypothetical protein JCGZ_17462 [Jatropha curcas]
MTVLKPECEKNPGINQIGLSVLKCRTENSNGISHYFKVPKGEGLKRSARSKNEPKRALSNVDYKNEVQAPKREAPPIPTSNKEDQLEEVHQLLLEIKQAQLEVITLFQVKIALRREKAPQEIKWLRMDSHLVRVEEPSIPYDLLDSVDSSLGSCFEIENFQVQVDFQLQPLLLLLFLLLTLVKVAFRFSEIEKLVEKIVAASLEKLLQSDKDKGKDHMVIEDDEAKGEFEGKEHVHDTWQDEEFFAKKVLPRRPSFQGSSSSEKTPSSSNKATLDLRSTSMQPRRFSNFRTPPSKVFEKVQSAGLLQPLALRPPPEPLPKKFNHKAYFKFHQGNGHI